MAENVCKHWFSTNGIPMECTMVHHGFSSLSQLSKQLNSSLNLNIDDKPMLTFRKYLSCMFQLTPEKINSSKALKDFLIILSTLPLKEDATPMEIDEGTK